MHAIKKLEAKHCVDKSESKKLQINSNPNHMREKKENQLSQRSDSIQTINAIARQKEKQSTSNEVATPTSTMIGNTEMALKAIQNVKDASSVFLCHPGIVYSVYKHEKRNEKNRYGVRRLTKEEKSKLSQNVNLDIANMITNHFPLEYCKVLGKMS